MNTLRAYPEPSRSRGTFLKKMFTKGKNEISLILIVLVLINFVSAHTGENEYGHHMMGEMYGMMSGGFGYGGMFFGWLTGLLITTALVLLIIWLIKQVKRK